MRIPALVVAVLLAVGTAGCTDARDRAGDGAGPLVVTTVSPITDIARQVAGSAAEVVGVVPEGVDSHEFQPRPSVARLLARADMVLVNGLHLEEPTIELARANLRKGSRLVELAARTVDRDDWVFDFSFPESGGQPNPHLWTNPPYAARFAEVIAEELARVDSANADAYQRNLERFRGRIDALDGAIRAATASVPPERRRLLTYHDSFPYFAREYGWTVIGAIQPSDFSEPTAREVAALIAQVEAEEVPAIFGSEVFPSPVLEQIGREADVRYVDTLRDDDLPGEPGDPEHTYLGLMRFDVVTIVAALGGDPAPLESLDVSPLRAGAGAS